MFLALFLKNLLKISLIVRFIFRDMNVHIEQNWDGNDFIRNHDPRFSKNKKFIIYDYEFFSNLLIYEVF